MIHRMLTDLETYCDGRGRLEEHNMNIVMAEDNKNEKTGNTMSQAEMDQKRKMDEQKNKTA